IPARGHGRRRARMRARGRTRAPDLLEHGILTSQPAARAAPHANSTRSTGGPAPARASLRPRARCRRRSNEPSFSRGAPPMKQRAATTRRTAPLQTPSDLGADASKDVSAALNGLLADMFALYLKTKNFHWHVSGPHFRDYHLLLDEQADQIYATTDPI